MLIVDIDRIGADAAVDNQACVNVLNKLVDTTYVDLIVTAVPVDPCAALDRPNGEQVVISTALDPQLVLTSGDTGVECSVDDFDYIVASRRIDRHLQRLRNPGRKRRSNCSTIIDAELIDTTAHRDVDHFDSDVGSRCVRCLVVEVDR